MSHETSAPTQNPSAQTTDPASDEPAQGAPEPQDGPTPRARSEREEQAIEERRAKIQALREEGVNPYPHDFPGRT
ncbi:MAG TPA: hypothetical protein VGX16_04825, partial [Solirubrobacteraceae bacterium]|nr:hypothetical protein [Solirubrobacteraceae bacterium]